MNKLTLIISFVLTFPVFGKVLPFEGQVIVAESRHTASFSLIQRNEANYSLVIKPSGASESCEFLVKRIAAPQQTRGRKGHLLSNRDSECQFEMKNESEEKFWNSILLIDLSYRLKSPKGLEGNASFNSLEKNYSADFHFKQLK